MPDAINTPVELRALTLAELPAVCAELRDYLLQSVSQTGGHLSASLGTVELTVALHYVFNTPTDKIIWDVGHQAYIHKIITKRRDALNYIRKKQGISGFPKRTESEFDTFGVGHSSTSVSAALGMALAAAAQNKEQKTIAVIGDGAMTAGMVYEAMNHAGDLAADMLVVLNDNDMSISPNVGGLRKYLTRILSGHFYSKLRESGKKILSPSMQQFTKKSEEHMKGMIMPGTLFEEMGFQYFGPIDGHDIIEIVRIFENIKNHKGPCILHVVTQKGHGYAPAEQDPIAYHGPSPFDLSKGIMPSAKAAFPSYTQVFGQWLCDIAEHDERIVGITPAMREGSGLVEFARRFPERYFDVAIAEQHAVTLAAGLACEGQKPIVAIYSTFLQRAYDQLIHDVAIQNLPVVFAIDRAGLVGADGPTHSGNYDISYLRCIPNMVIMTPAHEDECRQMLYTAYCHDGPAAVRYPRGKGIGIMPNETMTAIPLGTSLTLRKSLREEKKIALLLFGPFQDTAMDVAQRLDTTLVNMRFVKPMDNTIIEQLSHTHDLLVTLEDGAIQGGAGSAVNEYVMRCGLGVLVLNMGIPDAYIAHATREEQLENIGLDTAGVIQQIKGYANGKYCR